MGKIHFHKWGDWVQWKDSYYYTKTCSKCGRYKMRSIGFLRMFD
jgi:hypothetical protein